MNIILKIYGGCLKFFLQLNGGYWGRIGIGKYSKIEKKRNFYILPFYILLAFLFGLFSILYWYFILFYLPLLILSYLINNLNLNSYLAYFICFTIFLLWIKILFKNKQLTISFPILIMKQVKFINFPL